MWGSVKKVGKIKVGKRAKVDKKWEVLKSEQKVRKRWKGGEKVGKR